MKTAQARKQYLKLGSFNPNPEVSGTEYSPDVPNFINIESPGGLAANFHHPSKTIYQESSNSTSDIHGGDLPRYPYGEYGSLYGRGFGAADHLKLFPGSQYTMKPSVAATQEFSQALNSLPSQNPLSDTPEFLASHLGLYSGKGGSLGKGSSFQQRPGEKSTRNPMAFPVLNQKGAYFDNTQVTYGPQGPTPYRQNNTTVNYHSFNNDAGGLVKPSFRADLIPPPREFYNGISPDKETRMQDIEWVPPPSIDSANSGADFTGDAAGDVPAKSLSIANPFITAVVIIGATIALTYWVAVSRRLLEGEAYGQPMSMHILIYYTGIITLFLLLLMKFGHVPFITISATAT